MSTESQPKAEEQSAPGTPLGEHYELGEQLAEGAFFTTYRGRDVRSGRAVAIKILRSEFAQETAFQERLVKESTAVGALEHPGIVRVYDAWRDDDAVIIVTEYVRGINLKERIERVAPFPVRVAVDIALSLAEALEYAARAGHVHGDLRPENIIVTPDGQVRLTDFGVGIALPESPRLQISALPRSASYLAPELVEGKVPDSRSDIYALGAILFEMLTGGVPFEGDSPLAVAARHLHDPPPSLRRRDQGIPVAIDGICLKTMQKRPDHRYNAPADLLTDLTAVRDALAARKPLNWTPMSAPAESRSERGGRPFVTATPPRYFGRAAEFEEVEDDGPSWKLLLLGLGGILGVILVAFLLARLFFAPLPDRIVPGVVEKPVHEAVQILRDDRFDPVTVERWDDSVPIGVVYSQHPGPNSVAKEGARITLYVSRGSQPITTPDLSGLARRAAETRLRELGLTVGEVTEEFSETVGSGNVLGQIPSPGGPVPSATSIDLIISRGPEPVRRTPPPAEVQLTPVDPTTGQRILPTDPPVERLIREFEIVIHVPGEGEPHARVRITVTDEDGLQHEAYNDIHPRGDQVRALVSTRGTPGSSRIRVYVDDRLIHSERI